jgi:proteasome lid subunit RPN8/RPN11
MILWLTLEQARDILEHTRAEAPNEACGLLIGKAGGVIEVVRTRNEDLNPRTGFVVSPSDLFAVLNRVEQQSLELVGVYHSHPNGHPIPSERDIREAHYPEAAQLIVGMVKPEPEFAAWRIDAGRVSRVDLFIQAVRPPSPEVEPEKLTFSQRVAVIITGIIAVAIVLITAISLLPPPELPT